MGIITISELAYAIFKIVAHEGHFWCLFEIRASPGLLSWW
jgi:hypothetical protein